MEVAVDWDDGTAYPERVVTMEKKWRKRRYKKGNSLHDHHTKKEQ